MLRGLKPVVMLINGVVLTEQAKSSETKTISQEVRTHRASSGGEKSEIHVITRMEMREARC